MASVALLAFKASIGTDTESKTSTVKRIKPVGFQQFAISLSFPRPLLTMLCSPGGPVLMNKIVVAMGNRR